MLEPMISTPAPDGGTLPELLLCQNFVLWQASSYKATSGKFSKIPVGAHGYNCTGKLASHGRKFDAVVKQVHDLHHGTTLQRSFSHLLGRNAGYGIVINDQSVSVTQDGQPLYLAALDWDNSVVDGQVDPDVLEDIKMLGGQDSIYVETSVSGKGLRGFCLTREPVPNQNLGSFECYSHDRMMVVLGRDGVGPVNEVSMNVFNAVLARHGKVPSTSSALAGLAPRGSNASVLNADLTAHRSFPPLPPLERVLASIPAAKSDGCTRDVWRTVIWGAMSGYGATDATRVTLTLWSESAPGEFDQGDFDGIWRSFKRTDESGTTKVGSLIDLAKKYGSVDGDGPKCDVPPENVEDDPHGPHASANSSTERTSQHEGDIANGHEFATAQRDRLIFVPEVKEWYGFDPSKGWEQASQLDVERAAKQVAEKLLNDALTELIAHPELGGRSKRLARAQKVNNLQPMRAMIEMAKSEPGMSCSVSEFDANPMFLGVQNGVIDLRKGLLLSPQSYIRVSKRCAIQYDPEATCPSFEKFLAEVLPDQDVRDFIQRWLGYCLTGRSNEKKFIMLIGSGDNGKSILIELENWLLGSYAVKIDTEMLMHHPRAPQGPSPDIVALKGVRVAYANETSEGQRLADARVKDLTGGDTLTGRVPYGISALTFAPTHKLMLIGNHRPVITDTSSGMWSRVVLVPFEVVIPKENRDRLLLDRLKQEGSGFLNWMLRGCAGYLKRGLDVPDKLDAAATRYREDQDMVGQWINEHCSRGANLRCDGRAGYKAFQKWCRDNGHGQPSKTTLTRRLGEVQVQQTPCRKYYTGIELNDEGCRASVSY